MGIVSTIQKSCFFLDDNQSNQNTFLNQHGKQINDDYRFFQNQYWYRLQENILFDANKFIFLNTGYKERQLKLVQIWKIVDIKKFRNNDRINLNDGCLMDKWKYAIRKGVPIIYYKNIIQMLFAKNFGLDQASKKYQNILFDILKKNNNKIEIITFKQESSQAYASPFLNQNGIQAAKRIAFLISKNLNQIQYNPYIINVISLLLIFISQADTYDIIKSMIDGSTSMSVDRQQSLRWHFSLTDHQMDKFAREFFKTVKKVSPSINAINDHLNTEGIDKFFIFKDIVGNFFFGFIPFQVVCQTIIGSRIFYRFVYAILKMAGPSIRQSTNTQQILRVIKTKLLVNLCNQNQIKSFFRLAYDLRLENLVFLKKNQKGMLQSKKNTQEIIYYLPVLSGASQILSFNDLEKIWDFLPNIIKHYDAKKIFTTNSSNPSLNDMIISIQKETLTLLIVQCTNQAIFGVFLAEKIKTQKQVEDLKKIKSPPSSGPIQRMTSSESSSKISRIFSLKEENIKNFTYFGSSQSFVFTLSPKKQKFPSTGQNIFYCSFNDTNFVIGGPSSTPAFLIEQNLTQGFSYPCPTYANQPLHSGPPGQFKIKMIQCFAIQ